MPTSQYKTMPLCPLLPYISRPDQLQVIQVGHGGYIATDTFIDCSRLSDENDEYDNTSSLSLFIPLYVKTQKKDDSRAFSRGSKPNYDKMMFCMDVNGHPGDNVVVFILGNGRNDCFFDSCLKSRDNGDVGKQSFAFTMQSKHSSNLVLYCFFLFTNKGPGGLFVVQCPPRLTDRLGGEASGPRLMNIVDSIVPVKLSNCLIPSIPFQTDGKAGFTQHAFCLHGGTVKLTGLFFVEPSCPGQFCDCIGSLHDGIKEFVCPCFQRSITDHPCIAAMDFLFKPQDASPDIPIRWFTSKKATNFMFKQNRIRSGVRASALNEFRTRIEVRQSFDRVFRFVNLGGDLAVNEEFEEVSEEDRRARSGWSITGWVRRGKHVDQALDGNIQVRGQEKKDSAASSIKYHLTSLSPTFHSHLDGLEQLRYDSGRALPTTFGPIVNP